MRRRVEHDRADRRGPGIAARAAVEVDDARRVARITGPGSRRSCRSTRAVARPTLLMLSDLGGRDRQVTALAGGADEPGHADALRLGAAPLVVVDERGVDAGGDRVARRALLAHLGDRSRASASASAARMRSSSPSSDGALRVELGERRVERLTRLHQLELAVLDVALVAPQLLDVGLHRLELARRADLARVHLGLDLGGLRRRASAPRRRGAAPRGRARRARRVSVAIRPSSAAASASPRASASRSGRVW